MTLRGETNTFSLAAIVRMIHDEEKTGVLTVTRSHRSPRIYFRNGKIIYTSGNPARELLLGELLKANNLITESKLQEVLAVAKSAGKRLGVTLIEQGYVSREHVCRILLYQFKEIISRVLMWDNPEFSYSDGLGDYVEDIHLEIDPIRLLAEAQQRKTYQTIIPNDQVVFQIKPGALKSKSIYTDGALRVLLLINGKRTVSQIIAKTGFSRLAVYRTLGNLVSAGTIARKRISSEAGEMEDMEERTILAFYQSLLQEITMDLSAELGDKKAASCLEGSLRHSDYYERFLCVYKHDHGLDANLSCILSHVEKQGRPLSKTQLIEGFNQVVGNLFQDERRLLGSAATKDTMSRVRSALESVPEHQRLLTQATSRFLDGYEDGSLLTKTGIVSETKSPGPGTTITLSKIGNAAIVTFYNQAIQLVVTDLERELGTKARKVLQKVMKDFSHYGSFFSQLDMGNSSETSVAYTSEHIKAQGPKLSEQGLVQALEELLIALLQEESQLLGDKATQVTISRLMEEMRGQAQQKPFVDHLSASLVREMGEMGVAVDQ
jgi:hypothetical protein